MGFLDRAIKNGISKGISNAVGNAVKQVVEPKATEYANKVAGELDQATQNISQQTQETAQQAAKATSGLEGAFASLQQSMENYATQAAKNMKICPKCQTPSPADKTFCPNCGTKLPEETLAEGAVCPQCGKQNTVGTKFCFSCGAKLPFALAEEKAEADKNAAVLAKWAEKMPQYPVWNCGGTDFELEEGEDWFRFAASFDTEAEGEQSIPAYRALLKQNGFREAGQNPDKSHLYKKIDGKCYHVDTEHCFEGSMERPDIWFNMLYAVIIVIDGRTAHIGRSSTGTSTCSTAYNFCFQMVDCHDKSHPFRGTLKRRTLVFVSFPKKKMDGCSKLRP